MAETVKSPSQLAPAAGSLLDLYTVPALTKAVVSSLAVCNRGTQRATFRVVIAIAGAALADPQYVYYDEPVDGNRTFIFTIGATLGAADVVRVLSSNGLMSFNLFKAEIT